MEIKRASPGLSIAARRPRGRRASSSTGLVVVIVVLAAAFVLAARFACSAAAPAQPVLGPGDEREAGEDGGTSGAHDAAGTAPAGSQPAGPGDAERSALAGEPGLATPRPATGSEGGVIRGTVSVGPRSEFPATWRLVVGPSLQYQGKTTGPRRTLEREGNVRDFRVDDLPLAGYAVHAEAAGFNSLPVHVLLTEGSSEVFVTLVLSPAGFLDGAVLDADGRAVEGLTVTLENEATRARTQTVTVANGSYLFERVLDGNYTILFGPPDAPLVPPRELTFEAPSLRFPDVTLPAAGQLSFVVRDRGGRALSDVRVTGFSEQGGSFVATSDLDGRATARNLTPGTFRVFASTEDGLESKPREIQVPAGDPQELELVLEPR